MSRSKREILDAFLNCVAPVGGVLIPFGILLLVLGGALYSPEWEGAIIMLSVGGGCLGLVLVCCLLSLLFELLIPLPPEKTVKHARKPSSGIEQRHRLTIQRFVYRGSFIPLQLQYLDDVDTHEHNEHNLHEVFLDAGSDLALTASGMQPVV